ncbi:MAG: oligoendopeptidase F [Steroidobacteraceae bacterium]
MGSPQRTGFLIAVALVAGCFSPAPEAAEVPAPASMWDLSDLYASPESWQAAFEKNRGQVDGLAPFKGTLGQSSAQLLRALDTMSTARQELYRLYVYAGLKADEDRRVAVNQERRQQIQSLGTRYDEATSWLVPELLAVGETKVRAFIAEQPQLRARFDHFLDDVLRAAPHTLGQEAEGVLAASGTVLAQPSSIYGQLADAELPFPKVKLSDGTEVTLDQAAYTRYRESANRADRKVVFDAFWGKWREYQGTLGATLNTKVQGQVFASKVRKHETALGAALFADNIPPAVYRQLVAQANAALPVLHRYLRMRKRLLGITDDLAYYDVYPPMFAIVSEPKFSVADSQRITLAALAPLGEPYLAGLRRGFAANWMNVLPSEGKASGAYMNGSAYAVHPYLLLNHNNSFGSLSTFAHEWGHAVHSLLANAAQPFDKADYATFTAETASIGNEMLLSDYMVRNARTREEKIFYLGEALESIRGTFFRQTQFAEFELAIHEEVERGKPLSGARLTELYCGILKRYYGDAEGVMKIDPAYCIEWAFVPHFYRNFYVYQYATSMAGAAMLTTSVLSGGAPARERFLDLLRAGGSEYPYDLYKKAGIDMATPEPYQALVARMARIMDEIEQLERSAGK